VILRPLAGVPQVSVWAVYRVGSRNELPGMTGSTHWVEHMLFKGGGKLAKGDIDRLMSRLGGKFNGFTDKDWTMYYETVPADHYETALFIEAERMRNAAFDPKEFDAERTVVISEREGAENQPEFLVEEELWATAFHIHPYHWLPIGYMQDLGGMGRDEVYEYYRRWYAPDNAFLAIAGGFEPDKAMAKVREYFAPLAPEAIPPRPRFVEPAQHGRRVAKIRRPGGVDYFEAGWKIPAWGHADIPRIVMLTAVLGGWRGFNLFAAGGWTPRANRLYRGLVEGKLCSEARAGFEMRIDPSLLSVSAVLAHGVAFSAVEKKLGEIADRLRDEPPSAREMERARELVRAWSRYEADGVTFQGFMLSQLEVLGYRDAFPAFLEQVENVTADDVREAARAYLVDRHETAVHYHGEGGP
jgi:zinc protease